MGLRYSGRKLPFHILSEAASIEDAGGDSRGFRLSNSLPTHHLTEVPLPTNLKRKKHNKKKKKQSSPDCVMISEDPVCDSNAEGASGVVFENRSDGNFLSHVASSSSSTTTTTVVARETLRQRNVSGNEDFESQEEEKQQQRKSEADGSVVTKLETAETLDWKRLLAEDSNYVHPIETSPLKYFMEAMYTGNSLQSTTTLGDEKERKRVYDTIFHLPWRCELLIDVGFFVCFDSFLSLLTIMPTRIMLTLWRLVRTRQFIRPSAAELCDFACFLMLACAVTLLEGTDISLIYHMIRGQGTFKLYVVYNVLEEEYKNKLKWRRDG